MGRLGRDHRAGLGEEIGGFERAGQKGEGRGQAAEANGLGGRRGAAHEEEGQAGLEGPQTGGQLEAARIGQVCVEDGQGKVLGFFGKELPPTRIS